MSKLAWNKRTSEQEILTGMALVQEGKVILKDNLIINSQLLNLERVTVVGSSSTGGLPVLAGLVAEGLVDVAVVGNELDAASPTSILEALGTADKGKGVLLVIMADAGSDLTNNIVTQTVQKLGASVKTVIVKDMDGKGSLGVVPVLKVAMDAAKEGKSLAEVTDLAERSANNTVSVAFKASSLAETTTADTVAETLVSATLEKLALQAGDKVMLCLNGNENASLREQYAIYGACYAILAEAGLEAISLGASNYLCGQEDVFVQLAITKLNIEV